MTTVDRRTSRPRSLDTVLSELDAGVAGRAGHAFGTVIRDLLVLGLSFGVSGGLARGDCDIWSDLDLVVVGLPTERAAVIRIIANQGRVISEFTADHIGRPDIVVLYVQVESTIAKFDVDFRQTCDDDKILWCARPKEDDDDIMNRAAREQAVGWLWFCRARIERGEYFAANRSLDSYRENVLIPLLRSKMTDSTSGHRRIEALLPRSTVDRLLSTHPDKLTKDGLDQAFASLVSLTRDAVAAGGDALLVNRIDGILKIVHDVKPGSMVER